MSFACISIKNFCDNIHDPEFISHHRVSLLIDAFVIATVLTTMGLILRGAMNGGPFKAGIAWTMTALAGTAALADIICMIKHGRSREAVITPPPVAVPAPSLPHSLTIQDALKDALPAVAVPATSLPHSLTIQDALKDALPEMPIALIGMICEYDYDKESIYGQEAWKEIWKVDVVDDVPPIPRFDWNSQDMVLLYIPKRIRFHDEELPLTLKALRKITGESFAFVSDLAEAQFGDKTASGWVLIAKEVIPESRGKDYATQQKMVAERGYSMPSFLEAIVLNLMVFKTTGTRLYGREPWTYTRCAEKVNEQYPVVVGGFGSGGLDVIINYFVFDCYGAACALREFSKAIGP